MDRRHESAFISNPSILKSKTRSTKTSSSTAVSVSIQSLTFSSISSSLSMYPQVSPSLVPSTSSCSLDFPLFPPSQPPSSPPKTIIVWYRFDLRIHDHPALTHAIEEATELGNVIPIYCIDPESFRINKFGLCRTGRCSAQFLLQSLTDIRNSLRQRGSDLIIRRGRPQVVIPDLARRLHADAVICHREIFCERLCVEEDVRLNLDRINIPFHSLWSNTLYDQQDLPFSLEDMPEVYSTFREVVQNNVAIREPLPSPSKVPSVPDIPSGDIPSLEDLGFKNPAKNTTHSENVIGGEQEALNRLHKYAADSWHLPDNRIVALYVGEDFSIKIDRWFNWGCISPKKIYSYLSKASPKMGHTNTFFELMWRDFFRFVAAKSERFHRNHPSHTSKSLTRTVVA